MEVKLNTSPGIYEGPNDNITSDKIQVNEISLTHVTKSN